MTIPIHVQYTVGNLFIMFIKYLTTTNMLQTEGIEFCDPVRNKEKDYMYMLAMFVKRVTKGAPRVTNSLVFPLIIPSTLKPFCMDA